MHPHTAAAPSGHPHGPMRRHRREIEDRQEIDEILHSGKLAHLALSDNNVPFLVPVFYAYSGESLYFHSATEGTKIRILQQNPVVCFEVSIDHGIIDSDAACDFEARHRTVIGLGSATFVADTAEKIRALDSIVARFSERKFDYPKERLDHTAVIRIDIDSIKGKKYGF